MAQRARKARGRSDQRRSLHQQASADIIPRSKNMCLHRHFCEAVNSAARAESARAERSATQPASQASADIIRELFEKNAN